MGFLTRELRVLLGAPNILLVHPALTTKRQKYSLWIKLIHKLIFKTYGSTSSVSLLRIKLQINLIRKSFTDQVDP